MITRCPHPQKRRILVGSVACCNRCAGVKPPSYCDRCGLTKADVAGQHPPVRFRWVGPRTLCDRCRKGERW